MLYIVVLRYWSASRAAYTFVLVPVVTVVLSWWLDDEPIGASLVLGGCWSLCGSTSAHSGPGRWRQPVRPSRRRPRAAAAGGRPQARLEV